MLNLKTRQEVSSLQSPVSSLQPLAAPARHAIMHVMRNGRCANLGIPTRRSWDQNSYYMTKQKSVIVYPMLETVPCSIFFYFSSFVWRRRNLEGRKIPRQTLVGPQWKMPIKKIRAFPAVSISKHCLQLFIQFWKLVRVKPIENPKGGERYTKKKKK